MREIWLIRHGQSESNAGARVGATEQIGLTALGQQQAAFAAQAFTRAPARVITSAYRRAKATALPLLDRYPGTPCEEWPIHECAALSDEHRCNTTTADRTPLLAAYWQRRDPDYCDGPGAESFVQRVVRAQAALELLRGVGEPFVAVFGHAQFFRTMLWVHLAQPATLDSCAMDDYCHFTDSFSFPNAAILRVLLAPDRSLFFGAPSTAHLPARPLEPWGGALAEQALRKDD